MNSVFGKTSVWVEFPTLACMPEQPSGHKSAGSIG